MDPDDKFLLVALAIMFGSIVLIVALAVLGAVLT